MFRNLYVDPTSETWFLNKYIEAEIKIFFDKTRGELASDEKKTILDNTLILSITTPYGYGELRMLLISYLSTVNKLTSSFKYIYNGALITAFNVCHILRKLHCHNSRYILKLKNDSMYCVQQL